MKRVLVLGAGLVARPLVRYLTEVGAFGVTVASRTLSKAEALVHGCSSARAEALDVRDEASLERRIADHDAVVSLLPAPEHPRVARFCLRQRRHLATTSYVAPEMRALDGGAKSMGLVFLNECGLDPGLDHMTAMRVIDGARDRGGRVVAFRSWCGGLPAPEANDNPGGYKFSWSPRGVLTAATRPARYLRDGEVVEVPGHKLFARPEIVEVPEVGRLEGYPNRDSLGYLQLYGLDGARTMFRGTLRYAGHCVTFYPWVAIGLFDDTARDDLDGLTCRQFAQHLVSTSEEPRAAFARRLGLEDDSRSLNALAWLGLFDDDPLPENAASNLDVLAGLMLRRCGFAADERDMVVLQHEFTIEVPSGTEEVRSSMVAFGEPGGDSAMARTVSLPVAIATRGILEGRIDTPGVVVPVDRAIYEPVLMELESWGITCHEVVLL